MNVIIAQLAQVEPNSKRFNKYLKNECKNVDLVVLGEFVANAFFKCYNKKDKAKLQKHFIAQEKYIKTLAKIYATTIIMPVIECKNDKIFKSIMIANPTKCQFYRAQKLMNMEHWNERDFFDNDLKPAIPPIFRIAGLKASVMFGYEAHFDEIWLKLKKRDVDVVIVPTASTFNSNLRWERLLCSKAFVNNCFVIRANRVGNYVEDVVWNFYGNSFIALPDGNLDEVMDEKEGILIRDLDVNLLENVKNFWNLRKL